jgi:ABC-2 type transport system permease protein
VKFLRDTFVIARRELLERVRSKWFVVVTLLGPVGMIAMILIPALIASSGTAGTKVEIIDKTGTLGQPMVQVLELAQWKATVVDPATPEDTLLAKIAGDSINGFVTIPANALDGGEILYRGDNASSQAVQLELRKAATTIVITERGRRLKVAEGDLMKLLSPVEFSAKHSTGEAEGASGLATFFVGYILAFILYMVITLYGVGVMRSVVLEKTSRVMELMVAAVKPNALMAGKIFGVGAAGLLQVTVWLGMGALVLANRDTILGWFGAGGGGTTLPPLEAAEIAVVLVYFVVGFFFYAAMYAAAGAMVSSEQDTQQVQMPITMLLVIGVLCLQVISNDPRGGTAQAMTMVPLWSPMLMPMRFVLGGASVAEVAISLGILIASTALVLRAAAKIYRVGVLMYGKRPGLGELIRWLRY